MSLFPPPLRAALATGLALGAAASPSMAQKAAPMTAPRVDIVGHKDDVARQPGSGEAVERDVLERARVFTTTEALRKVPGVNARDEEGLGLRPNIGIRGLNPTRSTKVTLLEDGIPLSFAPYGDNASYFHPPVERFERIEVLKGAGQVLYGPQTIGGVINYITPVPTEAFSGAASVVGGNRGYLGVHARLSGGGFLLDTFHKQSDGARDHVRSEIRDLNLKKVIRFDERQALTLRANHYSEESLVTYSGITTAEFTRFGARYNPFRNDVFDARRAAVSATHEMDLGNGATLVTNVYGSIFNRDWWRQSSTTTDTQCGAAFRDDRLAGRAVNVDACASVQGRLRDYQQVGIEPRARVKHDWFGTPGELEAGLRLHREIQDRKQVNGAGPLARAGALAEDNQRTTNAMAVFAQNRFHLGSLTLAPGLRHERIDNTRTDRRPGGTQGEESLSAWIPSFAASYRLSADASVYGGLHRGFAPPRVEDLIVTGVGGSPTFTQVGAERSWNYELGGRLRPLPGLDFQATAFRNDFSRMISVGSVAGGSTPLSQGEALVQGLEVGARYGHPSGIYGSLALTWLPMAEQKTAFREVATGAVLANSRPGNRLPYAPRQTATLGVGYLFPDGLDLNLEVQHVGAQFADFANVGDAATDPGVPGSGAAQLVNRQSGQFGRIDAFTIFNATVNYTLERYGLTLFVTVKNLADRVYVVDRTRGILPGSPRLVQMGLRWDF